MTTPQRCMGCGGTHVQCQTQVAAVRLVFQLADALITRNPTDIEAAKEAYSRWI